MEIITQSSTQTFEAGQKIGNSLRGGEVLGLIGDLGSGKTTFIQGLAAGLGIKRVVSPTFVLMREYPVEYESLSHLYHLDLYRLEEKVDQELINLGLPDIWGKRENVVVIEWADKAKESLPKNTTRIIFDYLDADKRKIIIKQ